MQQSSSFGNGTDIQPVTQNAGQQVPVFSPPNLQQQKQQQPRICTDQLLQGNLSRIFGSMNSTGHQFTNINTNVDNGVDSQNSNSFVNNFVNPSQSIASVSFPITVNSCSYNVSGSNFMGAPIQNITTSARSAFSSTWSLNQVLIPNSQNFGVSSNFLEFHHE